ncbi:MAG: porin family protein [Myxococcota bacterium]|jgi:hypothetical protein|nr:porin family protein [Myxococcota bacterium]
MCSILRVPVILVFAVLLLARPAIAEAGRLDRSWRQSLFFGVGIGAGFEVNPLARQARDAFERRIESYSAAAFLFGVHAGYRLNEVLGLELGWHEQQHDAFREWGGYAGYHLLHLGLRVAWPLPTRQTLLLKIGACGGGFEYGAASFNGTEDNATFAVGPLFALAAEHELGLGIVAFIDVSWVILRRFGMSGPLELTIRETGNTASGLEDNAPTDIKDFTRDVTAQIVWLRAGIQFEWTLH